MKRSPGFKLITLISIAVGGYYIFAAMLLLRSRMATPAIVPVLTVLASIALTIAGLTALASLRTGLYFYIGSCVIWLLRFIPLIFLTGHFFGKMPHPVSAITGLVFGMTAIPFWLSLFGVIICYYELRKQKRVKLSNTGN